jgi:hypothetical protein
MPASEAYDVNPYRPEGLAESFDAARYPLAARAATEVFFGPDPDADFDDGLRLLLAGLATRLPSGPGGA